MHKFRDRQNKFAWYVCPDLGQQPSSTVKHKFCFSSGLSWPQGVWSESPRRSTAGGLEKGRSRGTAWQSPERLVSYCQGCCTLSGRQAFAQQKICFKKRRRRKWKKEQKRRRRKSDTCTALCCCQKALTWCWDLWILSVIFHLSGFKLEPSPTHASVKSGTVSGV